jgi:hypothetical protein
VLTSGALVYNDGGEDHSIEANENGSYTFTMPAADITIYAEFNKLVGFTIEGPQDEMVTVTVEHSTGHTPTEISWSGDETLTFTVEGYSAEERNLRWIVNGTEVLSATGSSLVIHAQDYIRRTYTLTALIFKNDQWYSGEYSFIVVE